MIGAGVLAIAVGIVMFVEEMMDFFPLLFFCFFVFAMSFVTLGMLAVKIIRKIRTKKAKETIAFSAYSHCAPMISKMEPVAEVSGDPRTAALNQIAQINAAAKAAKAQENAGNAQV